jgi:hypothetical protein
MSAPVGSTLAMTAAAVLILGVQAAAAKVRPVEIELRMEAGACSHFVEPTKIKMSHSKDTIIFDVSNYGTADEEGLVSDSCGRDQLVVLCSYQNNSLTDEVFEGCTSMPAGVVFNKPFPVKSGDRGIKRLICAVKNAAPGIGRDVGVLSGNIDATVACPKQLRPRPLHHTIQIEIVP